MIFRHIIFYAILLEIYILQECWIPRRVRILRFTGGNEIKKMARLMAGHLLRCGCGNYGLCNKARMTPYHVPVVLLVTVIPGTPHPRLLTTTLV